MTKRSEPITREKTLRWWSIGTALGAVATIALVACSHGDNDAARTCGRPVSSAVSPATVTVVSGHKDHYSNGRPDAKDVVWGEDYASALDAISALGREANVVIAIPCKLPPGFVLGSARIVHRGTAQIPLPDEIWLDYGRADWHPKPGGAAQGVAYAGPWIRIRQVPGTLEFGVPAHDIPVDVPGYRAIEPSASSTDRSVHLALMPDDAGTARFGYTLDAWGEDLPPRSELVDALASTVAAPVP